MKGLDQSRGEDLALAGERLLAQRRLPEALQQLLHAEATGCDADRCAAGRWMVYMLSGEFQAAWQESDAIRKRGRPDPNRLWNGEEILGKRVMIRCLHGFGDAVQFLRYMQPLRAIASRVTVEVPPRLRGIAERFSGVDEIITWGTDAPASEPAWDVQIEVMELPYVFRTELSDLPIAKDYLRQNRSFGKTAHRSHDRLRVGVNTSVGEWNPKRGIAFQMLSPLFNLPDVEFCDLRPAEEFEGAHPHRTTWLDNTRSLTSLDGLAETIAELDLVITADTLAAHLAGALGVRCWVLLQHQADWRWMHGRDDSPWYPTLQLFRQPHPGDWASVIQRVRGALASEHVNFTRYPSVVCAS